MALEEEIEKNRIEYIRIECGHFFQGELASEQRGSWILTFNGVLLLAVGQCFTSLAAGGQVGKCSSVLFLLSMLSIAVSSFFAFRVIVPLHGKEGDGWMDGAARRARSLGLGSFDEKRIKGDMATEWKHLGRHRKRAEERSTRVWLALLTSGIAAAVSGITLVAGVVCSAPEKGLPNGYPNDGERPSNHHVQMSFCFPIETPEGEVVVPIQMTASPQGAMLSTDLECERPDNVVSNSAGVSDTNGVADRIVEDVPSV